MRLWGAVPKTCAAPDCEREVRARGLCARHAKQVQRHGRLTPEREIATLPPRLCAGEGCARSVYGHGFCARHYFRWRRAGCSGLVTHYVYTAHDPRTRCGRLLDLSHLRIDGPEHTGDPAKVTCRECRKNRKGRTPFPTWRLPFDLELIEGD